MKATRLHPHHVNESAGRQDEYGSTAIAKLLELLVFRDAANWWSNKREASVLPVANAEALHKNKSQVQNSTKVMERKALEVLNCDTQHTNASHIDTNRRTELPNNSSDLLRQLSRRS